MRKSNRTILCGPKYNAHPHAKPYTAVKRGLDPLFFHPIVLHMGQGLFKGFSAVQYTEVRTVFQLYYCLGTNGRRGGIFTP
jgi:hypothetical protein